MELFIEEGSSESATLQLLVYYLRLAEQKKVKIIPLSKGALKAINLYRIQIKVPSLITSEGQVIGNPIDIAKAIIRLSVWQEVLLGGTAQEKQQINGLLQTNAKQQQFTLKNLQEYLQPRTFAVSNHITFADIHLFVVLRSRITQLTDQQKHSHCNIVRWFKHIQSLPGIKDYINLTGKAFLRSVEPTATLASISTKKK